MIISERQIMQLVAIANGAMQLLSQRGFHDSAHQISELIDEINSQQSKELKVID